MNNQQLQDKLLAFMAELEDCFACEIRTTIIVRPLAMGCSAAVVSNDEEGKIHEAITLHAARKIEITI